MLPIPDPYKRLCEIRPRSALLILFLLSAMLLTGLRALDTELITAAAPRGIVSFELAGNIQQVSRILAEWGPEGRVYAALSLGLDYLFLIVYALFISLACVLIARYLTLKITFLAAGGFVLGWGQFFAAILDAVENLALIRLLLASQEESWPVIARWCAIVKFGIVGAGLAYILIGTLIVLTLKSVAPGKR
jgi:hypothetical protein